MDKKENRGGSRPGAGNKAGSKRVDERRVQQPLSILPSIFEPFRAIYGRKWNRRVEELIKQDLLTSNNTPMNEVILIPATQERNGLVVRKVLNNGNDKSVEVRKVAANGRDNGIVATINESGFIGENGVSWRGSFKSYDMPEGITLDSLIIEKWEDIKLLF